MFDMSEVNQAAGKEWTLVMLDGEAIDTSEPPTMKFERGKLSIFGGVNRLSGSYALIGNQSVTLGQLSSTRIAGEPEKMELEQRFSKALASVDSFHVKDNQLDLLSGGKVVAVFEVKK